MDSVWLSRSYSSGVLVGWSDSFGKHLHQHLFHITGGCNPDHICKFPKPPIRHSRPFHPFELLISFLSAKLRMPSKRVCLKMCAVRTAACCMAWYLSAARWFWQWQGVNSGSLRENPWENDTTIYIHIIYWNKSPVHQLAIKKKQVRPVLWTWAV